jgi:2-phosphoglycerate kinase
MNTRVILIGGTSHLGKSTLAGHLEKTLGWRRLSTDNLARHPGRPWKLPPASAPPHVREYYEKLSGAELVDDVLGHYRNLVWPAAAALIGHYQRDATKTGLILEGSALWPDVVTQVISDQVQALWLTASDELIENRIQFNSRYAEQDSQHKLLIDKFVYRSIAFNSKMMTLIGDQHLPMLNIDGMTQDEVLKEAFAILGISG